MYLSEN